MGKFEEYINEATEQSIEKTLKKHVERIDDAITVTTRFLRNDAERMMEKGKYRRVHTQLGRVYRETDKLLDLVKKEE